MVAKRKYESGPQGHETVSGACALMKDLCPEAFQDEAIGNIREKLIDGEVGRARSEWRVRVWQVGLN